MRVKCKHCGKPLPKGRSKYCSDECKNAYFKKINRKNNVCEICGKELTGKKRKFCSNECRIIAQGSVDKFCVICGKLLTGNRHCFCSKECFEKAKASGRYKYDNKSNKERFKKPTPEPKKRGRPKKPRTFAEICKAAREKGLSYGQYVAMNKL